MGLLSASRRQAFNQVRELPRRFKFSPAPVVDDARATSRIAFTAKFPKNLRSVSASFAIHKIRRPSTAAVVHPHVSGPSCWKLNRGSAESSCGELTPSPAKTPSQLFFATQSASSVSFHAGSQSARNFPARRTGGFTATPSRSHQTTIQSVNSRPEYPPRAHSRAFRRVPAVWTRFQHSDLFSRMLAVPNFENIAEAVKPRSRRSGTRTERSWRWARGGYSAARFTDWMVVWVRSAMGRG